MSEEYKFSRNDDTICIRDITGHTPDRNLEPDDVVFILNDKDSRIKEFQRQQEEYESRILELETLVATHTKAEKTFEKKFKKCEEKRNEDEHDHRFRALYLDSMLKILKFAEILIEESGSEAMNEKYRKFKNDEYYHFKEVTRNIHRSVEG